MKRELLAHQRHVGSCCPGHDKWPSDTYKNKRSKVARSHGIEREHRYVRRIAKHKLLKEIIAESTT